jgi:hypothetical protein
MAPADYSDNSPAQPTGAQHTIAMAVGMLMQRNQIERIDALDTLWGIADQDGFDLVDAASVVINTKI